MKKFFCVILALSMLALCGCAAQAEPTTEPTQAPTTMAPTTEPPTEPPTEAPTEAPTEPPIPTNPLTGEELEAPHESRVFAVTINNVEGAMPLYGVSKADLFFEMYVNSYATRGLALFADITEVTSVGSLRSLRYNFTDIAQIFDAIIVHASGSAEVLEDLRAAGVPNISGESEIADYYFRDQNRLNAGYAWEHCLFVKGQATRDYAESKGIRVTQEPDKDYGLRFAPDGTPADGETAEKITINLNHGGARKQTFMHYDAEEGKYLFHQFGADMYDASEKQDVYFENVIVMFCQVNDKGVYHIAELEGSGEGYFACGGKIIPILWSHEKMEDPILFTHLDGTPLELGVGNSYIAIAPLTSEVMWE